MLTPGGLPRGRISLLTAAAPRGPSGRLTLLQSLLALASRSRDVAYVDLVGTLDPGFLADLGADLDACLVLSPEPARWDQGLAMARSLVLAGLPWVALALPEPAGLRSSAWEHGMSALVEAVGKRGCVAVIAAPAPAALPLRHASSLTLTCAAAGWQHAHEDVIGLRVSVTNTKCKLGTSGAEATLLLRYPQPYAVAEVTGLPSVVSPAPPAPARAVPATAAGLAG
jgi:hypothetical protein